MKRVDANILVDRGSGLKFLRSPIYRRDELIFLDAHGRRVVSCSPDGQITTKQDLPFVPAGLTRLPDGRLAVGAAWQRQLYRLDNLEEPWQDIAELAKHCLSDGVSDTRGGIYFSDIGYDCLDPRIDPVDDGVIVYVGTDGQGLVAADNLFCPNGILISPDQTTLVVAEAYRHCLTAFDIMPDGRLEDRRVWAQLDDAFWPNGLCMDRSDAIWTATTNHCAVRVRQGGYIDFGVATGQPVYDLVLGGPRLDQLFLLTSSSSDPVITRQLSDAAVELAVIGRA